MPKPEISLVYIADGFEEDCEALLQRYLTCNKHNYQVFCNVWKEMKFAYIFHARLSTAELGEFSEEVLRIAKKILVKKINNIEEAIGAMFILYSLVHLQPFKRFAHIRLVPEDVDAIKRIESFAREHKRYDVLYILGSLLIEGPVQYHLAEKEYGLERNIRKCFEEQVSIEKLSLMKGVLYQNMELLDVLQAETNISQKYKNAKSILRGKHLPQEDLNYSNEHLAGELTSSLKHLLRCGTFFEKTVNGNPNVGNTIDPKQTVARALDIKHRAMLNTVTPMKHLLSIQTSDKQEPPKISTTQKIAKDSDGKRNSRKILEISSKGKRKTRNNLPPSPRENGVNVNYIPPENGGVNDVEAMDLASLPVLTENAEAIETVPAVIEFIDEMAESLGRSETNASAENGTESKRRKADVVSNKITLKDLKVKEDIKIRRVPCYKKSTLNKFGMLPIANVTDHRPKRKPGSRPKRKNDDSEQ